MPRLVLLHRAGAAPEPRAIHGACTAGGAGSDLVALPGLPPAALRLEPRSTGLVVEAAAPGVRVAGRAVQPGGRRLLRPGERATVSGHALQLPAEPDRPPEGTRAMAASLLRDAEAAESLGPHLLVLTGPAAGERLTLGPEQTLGRSRRADLRLADPQASRLHARLRLGPGGARLEDLGAKNGVAVGGVRLARGGVRTLQPGDELRVGETDLALVLPGAPAAQGPVPAGEVGAATPAPRRATRRAAAALLLLTALACALAGI